MTKGKNRQMERRRIRKGEKRNAGAPRGKMMGAVAKRNYGGGGPVDGSKIDFDMWG